MRVDVAAAVRRSHNAYVHQRSWQHAATSREGRGGWVGSLQRAHCYCYCYWLPCLQAYLGPPAQPARYEILRSCVLELARAGLVSLESPKLLLLHRELCLLPAGPSGQGDDCTQQHPQQQAGVMPPVGDAAMLEADGGGAGAGVGPPVPAEAAALSRTLADVAAACEGFSGRALRKLPFLAHAGSEGMPLPCSTAQFLAALRSAAVREAADRGALAAG